MPFKERRHRVIGYGSQFFVNNISPVLIAMLVLVSGTDFAHAKPVTIAVLGDSLVQGYGLVQSAGFVPQLQTWLIEDGHDVILVNAGVSGDTTSGGLARINWTLGPDIDALVVSLGANDMMRGIDPELSRANLDAILTKAKNAGLPILLIGINAPANFGADYKAAFNEIYPYLATKHDTLLYPNFFQALAELADRDLVLNTYFQTDKIHPNKAGVALIVQAIGPSVAKLVAAVRIP